MNKRIPSQFKSESEAQIFNTISDILSTHETGNIATDVLLNAVIAASW